MSQKRSLLPGIAGRLVVPGVETEVGGCKIGAGVYKRREIELGGIKQIRHKGGLQNAGSISHSL